MLGGSGMGWVGLLPWLGAWLVRLPRAWHTGLLLALVACVGLEAAGPTLHSGPASHQSYISQDLDTHLILTGVIKARSPADTLAWWSGAWAGTVPFWRPISSLLFWTEWRVFGKGYQWWALVSVSLAVLLAAVMLWALTPPLGECRAFTAALVLFAGLWVPWERASAMRPVIEAWKNQPDLLAGIGVLAAVGFAVRRRVGPAVAAASLAAACKEIGFTAFVLMPVVAFWDQAVHKRPGEWRRLARSSVLAGGLLLAWHCHAVGVGYRVGPNVMAMHRALGYFQGTLVATLRGDDWWLAPLAACLLAAGRHFAKKPVPMLGVMLVAAALAVFAIARQAGEPADTALAYLLLSTGDLIALVAWLVAAWIACTRARQATLLGVAWMFIGAAPTFVAAQTLPHTRWLGSLGQAIIAAGVLQALSEMAAGAWRARTAEPAMSSDGRSLGA